MFQLENDGGVGMESASLRVLTFGGSKKISEGGKGGSNCCPPRFLAKRVKLIYLVMGALEKAAAK